MRLHIRPRYAALLIVFFYIVAGAGLTSALGAFDIELHGFTDDRFGMRTQNDPNEDDISLAESRLQLDLERMGDLTTLRLRTDLLYDDVPSDHEVDLEAGTGWIDLREANIQAFPLDIVDIKFGRQILTWGTGDLLFINDLFPKDWQSFFSGRDEEYLKAPSDALFVSLFPSFASIYVAYTPRFDPDRFISGDRLSYWNPILGDLAGQDAVVEPEMNDEWFVDDELAVRLSRNLAGYELNLYGYRGFWKSPQGLNPATMAPTFPTLGVYGASIRGAIGKGLFNIEGGYYDSVDDNAGTDPYVPNDEARILVGYERELMRDISGALQYYVEILQDYDEYLVGVSPDQSARDEERHVVTIRLTQQAFNQNLILSLFAYYSLSDSDGYIRPIVKYKLTDEWLLTAGGNIFLGEEEDTFFGQFVENNNIYVGARYSF